MQSPNPTFRAGMYPGAFFVQGQSPFASSFGPYHHLVQQQQMLQLQHQQQQQQQQRQQQQQQQQEHQVAEALTTMKKDSTDVATDLQAQPQKPPQKENKGPARVYQTTLCDGRIMEVWQGSIADPAPAAAAGHVDSLPKILVVSVQNDEYYIFTESSVCACLWKQHDLELAELHKDRDDYFDHENVWLSRDLSDKGYPFSRILCVSLQDKDNDKSPVCYVTDAVKSIFIALEKLATGYSISLPLIGMNRFCNLPMQDSFLGSKISSAKEEIIKILVTAAMGSMENHAACRKMLLYGYTKTEASCLKKEVFALQCLPPRPVAGDYSGSGGAFPSIYTAPAAAAAVGGGSSPAVFPIAMVAPNQNNTGMGLTRTMINSNEVHLKKNSESHTTTSSVFLENDSETDIILGMNDKHGITTPGTDFYKNEVRVIFERRKPRSVAIVHNLLQLVWEAKYHSSKEFTFWVSEKKAASCRIRQCGASPEVKLYSDHKKGNEIKFVRACDECIREDVNNNQVRGKRKASQAALEQEGPEDKKAKLTEQKQILEDQIKFPNPFASKSEKYLQTMNDAMDKLEKVNEELLKLAS